MLSGKDTNVSILLVGYKIKSSAEIINVLINQAVTYCFDDLIICSVLFQSIFLFMLLKYNNILLLNVLYYCKLIIWNFKYVILGSMFF